MEKFTSGPWFVFDDAGCGDGYIGISMGTHIGSPNAYNTDHLWFCEIEYSEADEETVATAHLISAAPEMYRLLKDIASGNGVDYPIEQLLAKARGER